MYIIFSNLNCVYFICQLKCQCGVKFVKCQVHVQVSCDLIFHTLLKFWLHNTARFFFIMYNLFVCMKFMALKEMCFCFIGSFVWSDWNFLKIASVTTGFLFKNQNVYWLEVLCEKMKEHIGCKCSRMCWLEFSS